MLVRGNRHVCSDDVWERTREQRINIINKLCTGMLLIDIERESYLFIGTLSNQTAFRSIELDITLAASG